DAALAEAIAVPMRARGRTVDVACGGTQTVSGEISRYDGLVQAFTSTAASDPLAPCLDSCATLLHSIKALTNDTLKRVPRFSAVTFGAQAAGAGDVAVLEQAPLWGVMRTLASEHAELKSRVIDLPATPTSVDFEALATVLIDGKEDQLAIRQGGILF